MLFMLTNSIALFIQIGDTVFFPFVYKRSTGDIFKFLALGGGDDTTTLIPTVIRDYWYMIVLWLLMVLLVYILYTILGRESIQNSKVEQKHPITSFTVASYVVFMGLIIMGCRGGWQLHSIDTVDAGDVAPPHDIPLVMNSPFSILVTYYRPVLDDKKLTHDSDVKREYTPVHTPARANFRRLNVVTIIMESMSKEYIGALNNLHKTHTPFLDSLITQSLVFDNAFSDGKKSIEGIPAVVASLPSWMNTAFITSPYTDDQYSCMAEILDKEGYNTSFFHGGHNGTMGFEEFCKKGGFKYYYGMKQYDNNKRDYDGNWGIWDEIYFQYFARTLDTMHQPFYSAIFSISSHHPFAIPEKYKNRFVQKPGEIPIEKCIEYSDLSLKEFFATASKMPWYDSTIFIITADHTGPSKDPYYSNRLGMYEIPLIFYMPHSNLKGRSHLTAEHIDIMPSILDYLHYPKNYYSFGKSLFDSNANSHYAINYLNDVYQIEKNPWCLQMVGNRIAGFYNYQKDSMLKDNLMDKPIKAKDTLAGILRKVLETYNRAVVHNDLKLKKGGI